MPGAEALARSYFDHVRARDVAAIARLYAPDGALVIPDGTRLAGGAAIAEFYRALFDRSPPTPEVLATLAEGRRCLVELVARQPDGSRAYAADVFTFDAHGRIAELVIYARAAG
jgi:uncharacterized protein (TIGR02246 family)